MSGLRAASAAKARMRPLQRLRRVVRAVSATLWLAARTARAPLSRLERKSAEVLYFSGHAERIQCVEGLQLYLAQLHVDVDAERLQRFIPTRCRAVPAYRYAWRDVQTVLERVKADATRGEAQAAQHAGDLHEAYVSLCPADAQAANNLPGGGMCVTRDALRLSLNGIDSVDVSDAAWADVPQSIDGETFVRFFSEGDASSSESDGLSDSTAGSPPARRTGFNRDAGFEDEKEIERSVRGQWTGDDYHFARRVSFIRDDFLRYMARLRARAHAPPARTRWYALARAVHHGALVERLRKLRAAAARRTPAEPESPARRLEELVARHGATSPTYLAPRTPKGLSSQRVAGKRLTDMAHVQRRHTHDAPQFGRRRAANATPRRSSSPVLSISPVVPSTASSTAASTRRTHRTSLSHPSHPASNDTPLRTTAPRPRPSLSEAKRRMPQPHAGCGRTSPTLGSMARAYSVVTPTTH